MQSIIPRLLYYYTCLCAPILLGFAFVTFYRPIKIARTLTQKVLYILLTVFFPLIIPLILVIISASLLIQPAFLLVVVLIVPLVAIFLVITYTILPRVAEFFRRLTGGLAKKIFSFIMNLPTFPLDRIDAAIDTLASYTLRILVRNPANRVIRRKETKMVMSWWGRRDGRVSYLLALARDPGLENEKRISAITELVGIATGERLQFLTPENNPTDQPQSATSIRLRELACDRAVSIQVRLMAAITLLNRSFRGEARQAFLDLAGDPKIVDPLVRVQIAHGLRELGPNTRALALEMLAKIMSDNSVPLSVRCDAARIAVPLCDTADNAHKIDLILRQWAKNISPQVRLQAARILAMLYRRHKNSPEDLALAYQWDQRAIKIAAGLVTIPYTSHSAAFSLQALQLLGNIGEIDRLIDLGNNERLSYPIRSLAARQLERLGQVDDSAEIWINLAMQTEFMPINPVQRIEASAAAGQINFDYAYTTKEALQNIAQNSCMDEPRVCLEAAAALRQLGWYEEAMSFVMLLDKNHRGKPEVAREIGEAMRWRDI